AEMFQLAQPAGQDLGGHLPDVPLEIPEPPGVLPQIPDDVRGPGAGKEFHGALERTGRGFPRPGPAIASSLQPSHGVTITHPRTPMVPSGWQGTYGEVVTVGN